MKTTLFTGIMKLSCLLVFACLFTYCSDYEDYAKDEDRILGIWNFDTAIDFEGTETAITGTIEFFNDQTFFVTDYSLGGSEWQLSRNYQNPDLYSLSLGNDKVEVLELTSKNMIWKSPDELLFLSRE